MFRKVLSALCLLSLVALVIVAYQSGEKSASLSFFDYAGMTFMAFYLVFSVIVFGDMFFQTGELRYKAGANIAAIVCWAIMLFFATLSLGTSNVIYPLFENFLVLVFMIGWPIVITYDAIYKITTKDITDRS